MHTPTSRGVCIFSEVKHGYRKVAGSSQNRPHCNKSRPHPAWNRPSEHRNRPRTLIIAHRSTEIAREH